jgi:2-C-methyl-D-erythritol 4-phosphate cytidylyltransferase
MKYSALVVAAGKGNRMHLGFNKVYARLENGKTILETAIAVFLMDPDCIQVVIVTNPEEYRTRVIGRMPGRITLCEGGSTRQESVRNGLLAVLADTVFIHDGARPFLDKNHLALLKKAMETEDAALLCVPCKDTIKKVQDGYIETTYDRSTLIAAQTPQAFRTDLIISCIEQAEMDGYTGTDDCSLVEKYSKVRIKAVEGNYANRKITTADDLNFQKER